MKRFLIVLIALIYSTAIAAGVAPADPSDDQITVLTTEFPPYSFLSDNKLTGLSTEIVTAVLAKANIQTDEFRIYPWARAFTLAKAGKHILIYSIARSPQRESQFQWVGPLAPYQVNLYKLKSRVDIDVNDIEQAKHYKVGGEYQDIKQLYLKSAGFKEDWNIELVRTADLNIRKLFAGRIDLLPVSETNLPYILRAEGFQLDDVEKVLELDEISSPLYMAFSLDVSQEVVERARQALRELREEGVIQKIYEAYMK